MSNKKALVIMVKNPVLGKVKTRLAKDIGDAKALLVYHELLAKTHEITKNLQLDKFVFYDDVVERNDLFEVANYKKYVQCSGNLGIRMDYAFSIPFKNEYKDVVMIGADCYELTQNHIEQAFSALEANHDFVLGPANDGGYYLIGMKKWNRWVLESKSWSTASLFDETKNDILSRNGKLSLLENLNDVDTLNDIKNFPLLMKIAEN